MKSISGALPPGIERRVRTILLLMCAAAVISISGDSHSEATAATEMNTKNKCAPTPADSLGPFYKPGAPVRSEVGKGYVLTGNVKAAGDCSPIAGAKIEFWLAGPDGEYHDAQRATLYSGKNGEYRFESNYPPPYASRPSHIHVKVGAPGFSELVTQHYPGKDRRSAEFDLVLEPARK